MDWASPETWRWVWLVAAVGFAAGEIAIAGSFYLAPFAAGAALAAVSAFAGAPLPVEWALFLLGSIATFAAMRPLARRLDANTPRAAVGATRWVNREALVLEGIGAGHGATGVIRLDREEWRAESLTGVPIPAGSTVLITRVDGTRLVVVPLEGPAVLPTEGVS
ncbi:MAG TPA: NfeD family protein [Acidimicrobiales bacterium]|nr:NfeD family protein [Acidimicrobiales bacterium]